MNIDELHAEISQMLEGYFGITAPRPLLDSLVYSDEELLEEIDEWGATDTLVRDKVVDRIARPLTGRGWPTYGDIRKDPSLESFDTTLRERVAAWSPTSPS